LSIDLHLLSALFGIIWVDLVLAGDNAVVVGMAAAGLPREQRTKVIVIGIAAATLLRITFAFFTTQLMDFIGLIIAGGILLLWVSWKLWRELRQQAHEDKAVEDLEAEFRDQPEGLKALPAAADNGGHQKTFAQAVTQIVVADVSMSLDNVIAVGSIAHDHPTWVLVVGLALSVAFMGIAATLIAGLLKKYRWIAYVGLAIILYVAGHMIYVGSVMAKTCTDAGQPLVSCLMEAHNGQGAAGSPVTTASQPGQ
jgi:YjbE family integral membrane protein